MLMLLLHFSPSRYSLDIIRIPGTIREALSTLKTSHPTLKAVLMGTRHIDPYSGSGVGVINSNSGFIISCFAQVI